MNPSEFEGTLVLEKLAEIGKVDEFFDAIDTDDFSAAVSLMKLAQIDQKTISIVIEQMNAAGGVES